MNAFLLHEQDKQPDGTFLVDISQQGFQSGKVPPLGARLKGLFEGKRLWLELVSQNGKQLELRVQEELPAPRKKPICVIVGISRPQTMKKVIHTAQVCGVQTLVLLKAAEAEKSYFQAEALQPENISKEISLAMAQAWDPLPCTVIVREKFRPFLEDELASFAPKENLRIFSDVQGQGALPVITAMDGFTLAIGPEAGWNDFEKQSFLAQDFHPFSFGERILRVETALGYGLGVCAGMGSA